MRICYMRVGDDGGFKGYTAETEHIHKIEQKCVQGLVETVILEEGFVVICETDAVLSGRRLNRALYDRAGKLKKVFAGDLVILRYEKGSYVDICEQNLELLEQLLKPIERIACGKIFLKDTRNLPEWKER